MGRCSTCCHGRKYLLLMNSHVNMRQNKETCLLQIKFLLFQVIFIFYCVQWVPVKYGDVEYPMYAHILGFGMSLASMLWIPGYAVYYLCTQHGSLRDVSILKALHLFVLTINISLYKTTDYIDTTFSSSSESLKE